MSRLVASHEAISTWITNLVVVFFWAIKSQLCRINWYVSVTSPYFVVLVLESFVNWIVYIYIFFSDYRPMFWLGSYSYTLFTLVSTSDVSLVGSLCVVLYCSVVHDTCFKLWNTSVFMGILSQSVMRAYYTNTPHTFKIQLFHYVDTASHLTVCLFLHGIAIPVSQFTQTCY